jgi:signal transduction histidine kinase
VRTSSDWATSTALANLTPNTLYPQLISYVQLGGLVEAKIVGDVTAAARHEQHTNEIAAYVLAGAALLILLLAILLSWLGIRSVSRSLRGVSIAAARAAEGSETELRRVADDRTESVDHSTLEALPVDARTEVGDFARAFVRAQRGAATVVARQAAARRNLAQMTGTAGRRSAQLVARQTSIIDRLERLPVDPDLRDDLHRLDHITNRLRRVTSSLLTLAVAGDGGRHAADESGYLTPMALADVVKLALDEIESETRIDVSVPLGTMVAPAIIDDVVLLFAELLANAAAFSRTATRVRVYAPPFDSGVSIVDEGIGMSEDQLATVNGRLAHPERLDLATSGALGLFLVGRLARRHDLRVTFEHTPGGGVTAIVDLGHHVTTMAPAETARATARVAAGSSIPRPRDGRASAFAGASRGGWGPMLELDSRPFDLDTFERAAEVLGTGPSWNAFEVLPPRFAELPAGPSQPELPGRGATASYSGAPVTADGVHGRYADDHPGTVPDFRDDMPRAGRGLAPADRTAYFGAASTGAASTRGDAIGGSQGGGSHAGGSNGRGSRPSGSFAGRDTDLPSAGGPFAAPGRPFAGMNRAFNDPLTGPLRPADASAPAGGFRPFDEDVVTFPAGGIARYVPPDDHSESVDAPADGAGASADGAVANATAVPGTGTETPLSRRVPGASSPASSLDLASRFRTLDPDEARRLVEQFETGVARALGETATDRVDDEGLSR